MFKSNYMYERSLIKTINEHNPIYNINNGSYKIYFHSLHHTHLLHPSRSIYEKPCIILEGDLRSKQWWTCNFIGICRIFQAYGTLTSHNTWGHYSYFQVLWFQSRFESNLKRNNRTVKSKSIALAWTKTNPYWIY